MVVSLSQMILKQDLNHVFTINYPFQGTIFPPIISTFNLNANPVQELITKLFNLFVSE